MTETVDSDDIRRYIRKRIPFRIGARGICIECRPSPFHKWTIMVPRASICMNVEDIDILEDVDNFHLTYRLDKSVYGEYHSLADLSEYSKVTVIL